MGFYGRHKVYVLFWPWATDPFMVTTDLVNGSVSKSAENGSQANITLYPRSIPKVTPDGRVTRSNTQGYMDVLAPNDWMFIFVDPMDGDQPEPLFMGLIDRVSMKRNISPEGMIQESIRVAASGWEKVCKQTTALSSPYLAGEINFVNLFALGSAGQQPELSDDSDITPNRSPGVGLFNDRLARVLVFLLRIFLRTNELKTNDENFNTEVKRIIEDTGTVEGARPTTNVSSSGVNPIFGQFELPGLGIPLWYFIVLRFQDLNQQVYVNPSMFLNQVNQSLAKLLDSFRNPLINELIYDVRRISNDGLGYLDSELDHDITGGWGQERLDAFVDAAGRVNRSYGALVDDVAPYLILRKRPLFKEELLELEGPIISEDELIEKDLGLSDADLHNLNMIDTPGISNNSFIRAYSGFIGLKTYKNETMESIKRHGMRVYNDSTQAWPGDTDAPLSDPSTTREWELRIHRAGLDNIKNYNGSITVDKYYRNLFLGGKIGLIPNKRGRSFYDDKPRVFYVDGIDYDFDNQTGEFSTSVAVTRGQEANELMR